MYRHYNHIFYLVQNKKRHQQLLIQLSKLKTQNYSFIPDILAPESIYHNTSTTSNNFYSSDSSSPASPTPSLDSVGSVEDCDAFRSSCLVKSRRQKRSRPSSSFMHQQYSGEDASIMNKRPRKYPGNNAIINQNHNDCSSITCAYTTTSPYNNTGNYTYNNNNNTTNNNNNRSCNSNDDIYNLAPLPSPDFDDLVDCMLTEEALNEIDITNYLPAL